MIIKSTPGHLKVNIINPLSQYDTSQPRLSKRSRVEMPGVNVLKYEGVII